MKRVYVEYNPYKCETTIRVGEDEALVRHGRCARLQEWVDGFLHALKTAYRDVRFTVEFHGTEMDFDDFVETSARHAEALGLRMKLIHDPAQEPSDKEEQLRRLIAKIREGPCQALKSKALLGTYRQAMRKELELCVTATVSAGKSTLINALLGCVLMPSGEEACTAIVSRLKDNDGKSWQGSALDRDGQTIGTYDPINQKIMARLNADDGVSEIRAEGNIPFVDTREMSLVLIDTPGPNNMRTRTHRARYRRFLETTSAALLLYVLPPTFGSDEDNHLLHEIADIMKVGGRLNRDRFIFILSKVDARRSGVSDAPLGETLETVRSYLTAEYGIVNPHVIPVAALPALLVRRHLGGEALAPDDEDELGWLVRKLNRVDTLHCEKYVADQLSTVESGRLEDSMNRAKNDKDSFSMALIHSGIPSLEAYIRQYVRKYATASTIGTAVTAVLRGIDVAMGDEKRREKELMDTIGHLMADLEQPGPFCGIFRNPGVADDNATASAQADGSEALPEASRTNACQVSMLKESIHTCEVLLQSCKKNQKWLRKLQRETNALLELD